MPRILLFEDLTSERIPFGSNVLVEYDSTSQWYNASIAIVARWLKDGGTASYDVAAQSPDRIRNRLSRLGLDVKHLESDDKLRIWDFYSATLGQKSKERYAPPSLKVADLSIYLSREMQRAAIQPAGASEEHLAVMDDLSILARFNDERSLVEFELSRDLPAFRLRGYTNICGLIRGLHSDWVYKRLEAAFDGVIDFNLQELGAETGDFVRIRTMRDVGFDRRWHRLNIDENFGVTLEK